MDVSEVDGAADKQLVSEALEIVWGILDDLLDAFELDRTEYDPSLERGCSRWRGSPADPSALDDWALLAVLCAARCQAWTS